MRKKILFLFIFIVAGGVFIFRRELSDFYARISFKLPQIEKQLTDLVKEEVSERISLPPPLRSEKDAPTAFLTREGIVSQTNLHRQKYGLPPLKENKTLDATAQAKVKDMFDKQYFDHESPSGTGPDDLANNFNYKFIAVGENLALGDFENDQVLVQAWMDSPGHRANILNGRYQEIGVGVGSGVFEGKTTWLAVQHFGLPLSACPEPNSLLKSKINSNQKQLASFEADLVRLEREIKTMPRRSSEYIGKINDYNELVAEYNALVDETKKLIAQFNTQVKNFNDCAAEAE